MFDLILDGLVTMFILRTSYLSSCLNIAVILLIIKSELMIAQENDRVGSMEFESSKFNLNVEEARPPRYLLYDVNPGEGFNLRRDVYMRIAVLVHELNKKDPWILVLPPWGRLYHWKSRDIGRQDRVPWSLFFDMESLKSFIPVMEFKDYLSVRGEPVIDEIYYLQGYKEGWKKWKQKMDKRPCLEKAYHYNSEDEKWYGWFFGYEDNVWANKMECISAMAHAGFIKDFLNQNTTGRSVMIDRGEVLLHDHYGDRLFWQARRSMRFAKHLRDIGDDFRRDYLDSNDVNDKTVLDSSWEEMERKHGDALGGPYVSVHLRRQDFVKVRQRDVPSLEFAAKQTREMMEKLGLTKIYVATDAPDEEYASFSNYLKEFELFRFKPSKELRKKYKDGGIAIIDQWIAAHAQYFIGTKESTFSFRIRDEREIMGFDPKTSFNQFCPNEEDKDCEQPAKWTIVY